MVTSTTPSKNKKGSGGGVPRAGLKKSKHNHRKNAMREPSTSGLVTKNNGGQQYNQQQFSKEKKKDAGCL